MVDTEGNVEGAAFILRREEGWGVGLPHSHETAPRRVPQDSNVQITAVGTSILTSLMNNALLWDVTQCDSSKNRCFGGNHRHHHQGDKNQGL
jgi:hypothetical protein